MNIKYTSKKYDKEITFPKFPKSSLISSREIVEMNVCDTARKCIVMTNFDTQSVSEFDTCVSDECVADSIALVTDDPSHVDSLKQLLHDRYSPMQFDCTKTINVVDMFRKSVNFKNVVNKAAGNPRIVLESDMDSKYIGFKLVVQGIFNDYEFISNLTTNNLYPSTLRDKLKKWLADSQKIFNYINGNPMALSNFDRMVRFLHDSKVEINNSFSKSYFQSFRTFMNNVDSLEFQEMFDSDEIHQGVVGFTKDLESVRNSNPTYNLKGIKINPSKGKLSVNFLGTTLDVSDQNNAKAVLTGLITTNQITQFNHCIERTKLINA